MLTGDIQRDVEKFPLIFRESCALIFALLLTHIPARTHSPKVSDKIP